MPTCIGSEASPGASGGPNFAYVTGTSPVTNPLMQGWNAKTLIDRAAGTSVGKWLGLTPSSTTSQAGGGNSTGLLSALFSGQVGGAPVAAYQNSAGNTFGWHTGNAPASSGYGGLDRQDYGLANNVPYTSVPNSGGIFSFLFGR